MQFRSFQTRSKPQLDGALVADVLASLLGFDPLERENLVALIAYFGVIRTGISELIGQ